jgi:hypothetical protein
LRLSRNSRLDHATLILMLSLRNFLRLSMSKLVQPGKTKLRHLLQ